MAFPHFRASGSWWLMFGESSPAVSGVGRDQNSRLTVLRCKVRSWWCKKTGRMIAICVQWSSLDNWWLDKCDLPLESGNIHGTKCPVRLMPKNRCRRSGLNNFAHSVFLPKPPHKIGGKSRQSVLKWRPTEEKQRHCLLQKPQLLAVACRFQGQVTFSPYWKFRLPEVKTPLDSSPEGAYRDLHGGMWNHLSVERWTDDDSSTVDWLWLIMIDWLVTCLQDFTVSWIGWLFTCLITDFWLDQWRIHCTWERFYVYATIRGYTY